MLGSRVSWQLLLGWALLLGQPAFGDPDATGEPSLDEADVLAPEEAKEPVPEDAEELAPVPEATEALVPELDELDLRRPISDEKLEKLEESEREWYEKELSRPLSFWVDSLMRDALEHKQKNSKEFYRLFENANLRVQKAFGTMIYLRMTLVETNCTNADWSQEEDDHRYFLRNYHADRYPRSCEPQGVSEDEIKDCTFTIFEDARTNGLPVVTSYKCRSLYLDKMENMHRRHSRRGFF